jgi:hypothetical protein
MTYRFALPSIFTLPSALSAACGTDSAGSTQAPAAGTLGGDCLPSGTCDVGLACEQSHCIAVTGAGGSAGAAGAGAGGIATAGSGGVRAGSGGITPMGGTSSGGATGGTGGVCVPGASQACACTSGMSGAQTCNARGTGFDPCVCAGGTGGNAGSGGSSGTGGACAGSQTDPKNCGRCGHTCRGTCTSGKCDPAFGGCFDRNQFDTCDAFCSSIGLHCAAGACITMTWMSWPQSQRTLCDGADSNSNQGQGSCTDPLPPRNSTDQALFNCCCGD